MFSSFFNKKTRTKKKRGKRGKEKGATKKQILKKCKGSYSLVTLAPTLALA